MQTYAIAQVSVIRLTEGKESGDLLTGRAIASALLLSLEAANLIGAVRLFLCMSAYMLAKIESTLSKLIMADWREI